MKNVFRTLVLTFLLFASTGVIYAQVAPQDDVYLNEISDFYLVDQTLVSDTNATLVPMGSIRAVGDVYHVDFEYEVVVKKGMDLQIMIEDLMFSNGLVTNEDLEQTFHFDITKKVVESVQQSDHLFSGTEEAERVIVTVSVSMVEPSTYELFSQLVGGQFGFEVYFFAAQQNA